MDIQIGYSPPYLRLSHFLFVSPFLWAFIPESAGYPTIRTCLTCFFFFPLFLIFSVRGLSFSSLHLRFDFGACSSFYPSCLLSVSGVPCQTLIRSQEVLLRWAFIFRFFGASSSSLCSVPYGIMLSLVSRSVFILFCLTSPVSVCMCKCSYVLQFKKAYGPSIYPPRVLRLSAVFTFCRYSLRSYGGHILFAWPRLLSLRVEIWAVLFCLSFLRISSEYSGNQNYGPFVTSFSCRVRRGFPLCSTRIDFEPSSLVLVVALLLMFGFSYLLPIYHYLPDIGLLFAFIYAFKISMVWKIVQATEILLMLLRYRILAFQIFNSSVIRY